MKKGVAVAVGVGFVALIGAAGFLLKDRFSQSSTRNVEPPQPAVAATPQDGPSTEPPTEGAAERAGVILQDEVRAVSEPFKSDGPVVHTFRSGDTIVVLDMKSQAGSNAPDTQWYKIGAGEKEGWVEGKDLFVFDDQGLFDTFIASTQSATELFTNSAIAADTEKLRILDSPEFLVRSIKNPNRDVSTNAQRKIFYRIPAGDVVATWFQLLSDPSVKELSEIKTELMMAFTAERVPASSEPTPFKELYPKQAPETRARIFKDTCPVVLSSKKIFETALQLVGKDTEEKVFDAFLGCVGDSFASSDGADTYAPALQVLQAKGSLESALSADKVAKVRAKIPAK